MKFNLTGQTAGQFKFRPRTGPLNYQACSFRFNTWMAERNLGEYLSKTVPHEVAHYVTRVFYEEGGIKSHGPEWGKVMRECFGLSPDRCHQYELPNPHVFQCSCPGSQGEKRYTTRRLKSYLSGGLLRCRQCGMAIIYSHTIDVDSGEVLEKSPVGKVFVYTDAAIKPQESARLMLLALNGYAPSAFVSSENQPFSLNITEALCAKFGFPHEVKRGIPKECSHLLAYLTKKPDYQVAKAISQAKTSGILVKFIHRHLPLSRGDFTISDRFL